MCMIGDDDGWKIYRQGSRRARKSYRCDECGREIAQRETYEFFTGLLWEAGSWMTVHTCAHCVQAKRWLMKFCDGYMFEATAEDMAEHVNDGEESYMHTDQLATLVEWQAADWYDAGHLRPVDDVARLVDEAIVATDDLVAKVGA